MEAVPKLSMLNFEPKYSPENTDFVLKLKKLIRTCYNEDPEAFMKELEDISTLRLKACIRPTQDITGIANAKKYYCQLHFLQNRFRIKSGGGDGPFAFPWYDVYSGSLYTFSDLHYEMASVLYNAGALHSSLGSREDRGSSDGMKVACTHFQCAAWAFHTLPDRFATEAGTDLSSDLLAFISQVCLAQAQECILEKSILDHRKSAIIAKVGAQVADYYRQAFRKIEASNGKGDTSVEETIAEVVGNKLSKFWTRYVEFKMTYYTAVSYLYMGMQSEENSKWGEGVAFLAAASDKLTVAGKMSKSLDSDHMDKSLVASCLNFSSDVINGKWENAKKDNEFIYHEKVPELDTLPDLKGASLVKGIGFEVTDIEISGPDVFGRLVPMEAHEASSLYSEEKAKVLRNLGDKIEQCDAELAVFLSSLKLEEVPSVGDHIALPQELIECAAGLSVKEKAVKKLTEAMARIAAVSADVESSLHEIKDMLKSEEEQEEEYVAIVGKRPSHISAEMERELAKYTEAHSMASESNATLHKAMQLHINNLRLLSKPLDELQTEIPSMADLDEDSEASIAEVHRILKKVQEMRDQRSLLTEQFRNDLLDDDITKKLVLYKDKEMDEIFTIELKKHEQKRKVIEQNLIAQGNILQALTEVNAKYASTRRTVSDLINARNEMIGALVASYYAYEDLLHKAAKGLEFYDKLDSNVTKLLNKVKGVVEVQQEERDAVLAKHAPPLRANNFPPPPGMFPSAPSSSSAYNPAMYPTAVSSSTDASSSSSASGKPTLKDYLKAMKETNASASTVYAAMNNLPAEQQAIQPKIDNVAPYQQPSSFVNYPAASTAAFTTSATSGQGSSVQPSSATLSTATNTIASNYGQQQSRVATGQQYPGYVYPGQQQHQQHWQQQQQQQQQQQWPSGYPQQKQYARQPEQQQPGKQQQHQPPGQPDLQKDHPGPVQPGPVHPAQVHPGQNIHLGQSIQPGQVRQPVPIQYSVGQPSPVAQHPQTQSSLQHLGQQQQQQPMQYPGGGQQHYIQQPTSKASVQQQYGQYITQQVPPGQVQPGQGQPGQGPPGQGHPGQGQPGIGQPRIAQPGIGQPGQSQPGIGQPGQVQPRIGQPRQGQPAIGQPSIGQPGVGQPGQVQPGLGQPRIGQPGQGQPGIGQPGQIQPGHIQQINPGQAPPTSWTASPQRPQHAYQHPTVWNNSPQAGSPTPISTAVSQPYQQQPHQQQPQQPQQHQQQQQQPQQQLQQQQQQQQQQPTVWNNSPQVKATYPTATSASTSQPYQQQQTWNSSHPSYPQATISQYQQYQQYPGNQQQQQPAVPSSTTYQTYQQITYPQRPQTPVSGQQQAYQNGNMYQQPRGSNYYSNFAAAPASSSAYNNSTNNNGSAEIKLRPVVPQPGTVLHANVVPQQQVSRPTTLTPTTECVQRRTSLDDMLNEVDLRPQRVNVLQPKVMTPGELKEQKLEAQALEDIALASAHDPYEHEFTKQKLLDEVHDLDQLLADKLALDAKWKEMNGIVDKKGSLAISVARCYPMKNRVPDVLPFDVTRVELPTTKDDYINASHVRHLSAHSPRFIATQAPNSKTLADFWTMVWQESVETMVCLLPEVQDVYWPVERKEPITSGDLEITLQSAKMEPQFTERIFTVMNKKTNTSRVVIHIQLLSGKQTYLDSLVDLTVVCLGYHRQQRVLTHPIVVHCLTGSGKSAVFMLLAAAMAEIDLGRIISKEEESTIIPNLVNMAALLCQQRKGVLREKEHFKQAYQGVSLHAKNLLVKKGALPPKQPTVVQQQKQKEDDIISDLSSHLSSQLGLDKGGGSEVMTTSTGSIMTSSTGSNNEDSSAVAKEKPFFSADLNKLADLSLDPNSGQPGAAAGVSPGRKKITKQDFLNADKSGGGLKSKKEADPADPLSQLDPLWSMK